MAPNLLVKAAFVRGEYEDCDKRRYFKTDVVRTDFILQNVFSYLLGDHYIFDAIGAMNKKEKDSLERIKEFIDAFRVSYLSPVKSLCAEIDAISENTVESILLGVSNELFSEGITWSRIIAFFVFIGELTIMCISKKLPKSIVDVMYESFLRLVKEKLEPWIEDHKGWEGIGCLSIATQQESSLMPPENLLNGSTQSWGKSLLCTTVRMIGALASLANAPNNCF